VDIDHRDIYGETPILTALSHGNCDLVKLLIQRGADLGNVDEHGNDLFHHLALFANAETMDVFSKTAGDSWRGWSTEGKNADGRTPLQLFADRNPDRVLRKSFDGLLDAIDGEKAFVGDPVREGKRE